MTLMNFHLNTTNNSSINFISFFNSSINLTVIIFKSSVKKHLEELCGKFLLSGKQLKISSVCENEAQKFQIFSQDKNYSKISNIKQSLVTSEVQLVSPT